MPYSSAGENCGKIIFDCMPEMLEAKQANASARSDWRLRSQVHFLACCEAGLRQAWRAQLGCMPEQGIKTKLADTCPGKAPRHAETAQDSKMSPTARIPNLHLLRISSANVQKPVLEG